MAQNMLSLQNDWCAFESALGFLFSGVFYKHQSQQVGG